MTKRERALETALISIMQRMNFANEPYAFQSGLEAIKLPEEHQDLKPEKQLPVPPEYKVSRAMLRDVLKKIVLRWPVGNKPLSCLQLVRMMLGLSQAAAAQFISGIMASGNGEGLKK